MDRVVATSPNYLQSSKVLQKLERVDIIPIGIDKTTYPIPDRSRMDAFTARFGPKFLLFVGMLRYYKGLHILIEALVGSTIPVLIVGSGPVEAELQRRVRRLGLSNVHFLGFVSDQDRSALLALCFAVVFPSHLRSEAFGISLLEGAMFGKPMISSEIGTGTTYVNVDGETGIVVPPSDPGALRQAIERLWNAPDEAKRMGLNAEARYWQFFTAQTMVGKYIRLYQQLTTQ
jgi:rhamnosyl/mannosyltransferase